MRQCMSECDNKLSWFLLPELGLANQKKTFRDEQQRNGDEEELKQKGETIGSKVKQMRTKKTYLCIVCHLNLLN